MTSLIACLGSDQRMWPEYLQKLVEGENWETVFIVGQSDGFKCSKQTFFIMADTKLPLAVLTEKIREKIQGKIMDTEVAVNIALGTGKEHMALISAVLKTGLGVRLVAYTPEGVKEV